MLSPETLAQLKQQQAYQAGAWERVIETARKYALMETTGTYLEDTTGSGHKSAVRVHPTSRKSHVDYMAQELLQAAVEAFREDAMLGAAMMAAKES